MLGYRHHQQTGRKISPNIHSTKGRGQTPPALWILSDCLWLRCSAEMQAYSEDAEMTFEVYARGWLERQTKYAPYDRLLPTFARNRVPGVGGMGSYFYHSLFNASATSCAMRCLSSSLFARAYRSSAASRRSAACRDHTSNSPLVINPLLIRAKYFL